MQPNLFPGILSSGLHARILSFACCLRSLRARTSRNVPPTRTIHTHTHTTTYAAHASPSALQPQPHHLNVTGPGAALRAGRPVHPAAARLAQRPGPDVDVVRWRPCGTWEESWLVSKAVIDAAGCAPNPTGVRPTQDFEQWLDSQKPIGA